MKHSISSRALLCIVAVALLAVGCSKKQDTDAANEVPVGRLGTAVIPQHYALELRIDPRKEHFSGTVAIDVVLAQATDGIWLHGKDLSVSEAWLVGADGSRIAATYEERDATGIARVSLASTVPAGEAVLHFEFSAPFNDSANALYRVERDDEFYAASQLQPISARRIFPGFDEPAFKVPFDLSIVTRGGDVAVTTTPEKNVERVDDDHERHTFETTRPMPTYLLAFAAGAYEIVDYGMVPPNAIRDHELHLRGVVAKDRGQRIEYALENTDGLLTVLEEYFGTPYPYRKLDLIAVPASFGGAMENIGAIVYDEYLMLMDEESPLQQRRSYTAVHAHEMAHMWFGNLVTPEWWNDIWLNEAFASWMMYKAADAYWPDGEFDRNTLKDALGAMSSDSLAAARQIREPIDHSDEIATAFDSITYRKGGGVLAMLERYVGEDAFREGIRLHMQRHADATATAEDFIASVAEGSDRSEIEGAFRSFVEQPGVPLLSVSIDCESAADPALSVRQARYAPLGSAIDPEAGLWQVPMCVSYEVDGRVASSCSLVTERSQTIRLELDSCPAWVHPNADGAGYYRFAMDDAGWQTLIDNVGQLSTNEALVLVDSFDASLRAGHVKPSTYVSGMAALLTHDAWHVADKVRSSLAELEEIVDIEQRGAMQAGFRGMLRPVFDGLGEPADVGEQLLQQRLQQFLAIDANDTELRDELAGLAIESIGLYGEPNPGAMPADQRETVLIVGVQDVGDAFFDLLLEQAQAARDPAFRSDAISALSHVTDPALVAKLHAALLDGDFKGTELLSAVFQQMSLPDAAQATFDWLRGEGDTIVGMLPQTFRSRYLPLVGSKLCSGRQAEEWRAFVESHAAEIPGYERGLAQAMESIQLCVALKNANAAGLAEAFSSQQDPR